MNNLHGGGSDGDAVGNVIELLENSFRQMMPSKASFPCIHHVAQVKLNPVVIKGEPLLRVDHDVFHQVTFGHALPRFFGVVGVRSYYFGQDI